jgi:hypothetical protein
MEVPRVLGRISDEECLGARIKTADRQLLSDAIPLSSAARHKEMAHRIAAVEQRRALCSDSSRMLGLVLMPPLGRELQYCRSLKMPDPQGNKASNRRHVGSNLQGPR